MTLPKKYVDAYIAQEMTVYDISELMGTSPSGVWKSLRDDYHVDTGRHHRRVVEQVKARNEEIMKLHQKGVGVSEIGRKVGLSRQRVFQIVKKLGSEVTT